MEKAGLLIGCFLCLTACSSHYLSNNKQLYAASRNGPRLEIPSPLSGSNMSGFYDLPTPDAVTKVSLSPPQV